MAAVAKLYATLGLDNRGFLQGLTQSQSALSRFAGGVGAGLGIGAGLGVYNLTAMAVREVAQGFFDITDAARNMTETQTKLDYVFRQSAGEMRAWADNAAQTMIMSEQAALASAANFGNFLQALDVSEDMAAEMSRGLVQLSADLASFNNLAGGAEEATMRLFSGMSGEMEAVRRLGIDLSETAVTTYLLEKGVKRVGMQFRQSDKTMARYALIMQDTAMAQGDVERTATNLANRQRELNAEIGNLQANLGAGLVGPMADFTGWLADVVGLLSGPNGATQRLAEFADVHLGIKKAMEGSTEATKEWHHGLGDFEMAHVNTIMGDIAPHIREQVLLWLEYGEALEGAGLSFHEWRSEFERLQREGLSTQEALDLTLAFTRVEEGIQRVNAAIARTDREDWDFFHPFIDRTDELKARDAEMRAAFKDMGGFLRGAGEAIIKDGGQIPEAFAEVFDEAVFEINKGFGNVKSALSGDPGIVAPEKRLENMRRRLAKAQANLRLAQRVGDPIGIAHWTRGVARAQTVLDRFEGATGKSKRQIVSELEAMGLDTSRIWGKVARDTDRKSDRAADEGIQAARRMRREIKDTLENINMENAGRRLISSWVHGINSAEQIVLDAGETVADWFGQWFHGSDVPTKGPLKGFDKMGARMFGAYLDNVEGMKGAMADTGMGMAAALTPRRGMMPAMARGGGRGDGGGLHVHIHGNVYGGQPGLRQLAGDIERAVRPTRRDRRRRRLPEG